MAIDYRLDSEGLEDSLGLEVMTLGGSGNSDPKSATPHLSDLNPGPHYLVTIKPSRSGTEDDAEPARLLWLFRAHVDGYPDEAAEDNEKMLKDYCTINFRADGIRVLVSRRLLIVVHGQDQRVLDRAFRDSDPLADGLEGGPALLFALIERLSQTHYAARRRLSRCQSTVRRAFFDSLSEKPTNAAAPITSSTLQAALAHIGKQAHRFRAALDAYKPSGADKRRVWWDSPDELYQERSQALVEKVWGVRGDLVRFREAESADMQLLATAGIQDLLRRAKGAQTAAVVFAVLTALVAGVALFGTLAAIPADNVALRPLVKGAAAAGLVIMSGVAIGVGLKALSEVQEGHLRWLRKLGQWLRWLLAGASFSLFLFAFLFRDLWGLADEAMLYIAVGAGLLASAFHVWYEHFD